MTWGFGKVILLGEHAVVYGHPALAGSLQRGVRASASALAGTDTSSILTIPSWKLRVSSWDDHPVAAALRALLERIPVGPVEISAQATVPPAAGLGSSAAMSVALTRALAHAAGRSLALDDIEAIASLAERCFHDRPSGIDVALAARGGLGLFHRKEGLVTLAAPPLRLAIGLSGEPRRTADMVGRVAAARRANRRETNRRLEVLGQAAVAGAQALTRDDLDTLGALMVRAHEVLAGLDVSTPKLGEMVAAALNAGALGAKLTGAGGGGAVIALAPGREADVLEAWRSLGFEGFASRVGVKGDLS